MPPAQSRTLVTRRVEEGTTLAELPPRKGRIRLPAEFYGHYVWSLCYGCGAKTRSYCRLCGLGVCKRDECKLVHQLAQRTTMKASTCVSEDT